jgi:ubiquinone/menaquinone biosynthesis C-methylase UbiE
MINLDLGCGYNKQENHLGVDIRKIKIIDIIADLENIPIRDNCIDQIYSRRALQHIKNQVKAFKEIHRILKPGGEIKIIVASFWGFLFYKSGLSQSSGKYQIFHLFTKRNLTKQLKQLNFKDIKIHKIKSLKKIGYDFKATAKKIQS